MKFFCLILLLSGLSPDWESGNWEADNELESGLDYYRAGKFPEAAAAFEKSVGLQPSTGALVNLGLAEWHNGHTGEAVLAWEQASWIDPFDAHACANLQYAREFASLEPPNYSWYERTSTWLPANCWTWLAGGSLWLAVALVTVPGFFRMRKAGWHQTVAALALGIFLLSLAPSAGIVTRSKIVIVTAKNTLLRLTPTESAETVASLPPGEPVRTLSTRGDYFFVHTQNGNGWVGRGQIRFLCPEK
jgi:tetratricopeptide (TPR) repeat protein